jgi:hypothetical protein
MLRADRHDLPTSENAVASVVRHAGANLSSRSGLPVAQMSIPPLDKLLFILYSPNVMRNVFETPSEQDRANQAPGESMFQGPGNREGSRQKAAGCGEQRPPRADRGLVLQR